MKGKIFFLTLLSVIISVVFIIAFVFAMDNTQNQTISQAVTQPMDSINSNWLKRGYEGYLGSIEIKLGTEKEKLLHQRGVPLETGYYEGGEFFRYEDVTFFVNPETKKIVAIAMEITKADLTVADMTKMFGKPDRSEENKMEDMWMFTYHLGEKNRFIFESKDDNENTLIEFVWLRETID